jgi:two-component system sensor histidine kinase YesM
MDNLRRSGGEMGGFKFFCNRLANKLIFTFTVTISIFITAFIGISYRRTNDILIKDVINANKSILILVDRNFRNYLTQVDELSITLRKEPQFMEILLDTAPDYPSQTYLKNQLKILFYSRNDLEELRLYVPGSKTLYSISRSNDKLMLQSGRDLVSSEWYRKTVAGEFFRYIEPLAGQQPGGSFLTFNRAWVTIPGWKPLGVISLSLNRLILDQLIMDTLQQPGEVLCIYDRNNQTFYRSDPQFNDTAVVRRLARLAEKVRPGGWGQIKIAGREYLAIFSIAKDREWKIVKLIPVNLIKDQVRQTRDLSFLIGLIFIVAFILLIIIVTNTITKPLRRLANQMAKVGEGNFNVKVETGGSYELTRLAEKFNYMVDRINQLINEKYLAQINEKTARLKALEAQINPHFLYNSLQAIATKTTLSGMKEISRMIEDLAYILRYCIKGGEQVEISQEIQHIQKYLHLQKARFEERLTVVIEVAEGTAAIPIPKLSIQTLVENAVQHALEHMIEAIRISIRIVTRSGQLLITVTDNGPGMTEERLGQVRALMREDGLTDSPGERLGIKNLYSRLKLMYGEQAQLIINSVWGQGTEVTIILPFGSGGETHV